jgi:hypothetical protein
MHNNTTSQMSRRSDQMVTTMHNKAMIRMSRRTDQMVTTNYNDMLVCGGARRPKI